MARELRKRNSRFQSRQLLPEGLRLPSCPRAISFVQFRVVCVFFAAGDLAREVGRSGRHPFAVPQIPVFLNDVLACEDFCGGVEPRIGQKHIRVLAIDGFPRNSSPGLLRELDSLSVEYRWNTRAVMLDAQEAEAILDKTRKKWRSKIRGWRDQVLKTESGAVNLYAAEMAGDAEHAMSVASSGDVHFGWYSSNIICMDDDIERLNQTTRTVMKTLQHIGFSCRIETVNAVEAWRGSLPGDGYRNVRRNLLHTLNIADLLPITAVWAGQRDNPSALMPRKSPPLLYAATSGSTPFRFNLHVNDLGHTMICGPSGAGKSTLLGLLAAQWFRYPGAQVFAFDRGNSLYVLTQAVGGEFYDLAVQERIWRSALSGTSIQIRIAFGLWVGSRLCADLTAR